ncbi:SDR family NAD(P)-dependent oxidoreductase [Paenibacillus solani]|uniref:SDR family NAD(P)-dependent oxidoreductase n=1 Tax=Paenibacillus solani TaxID=1705565 RepID=UPI003D2B9455
MTKHNRIWFITGASKGLGYTFTRAALEAGDRVVAAARTISTLDTLKEKYPDSLLPMELDVRSRESVFTVVKAAVEHFGRLDIIVNN